jgi:hypothetical protein
MFTGRPKEVVALYQKLMNAPPERAAAVRRTIVGGETTCFADEPGARGKQNRGRSH